MKVLIAEDDSTSAIVLRKALEKLGHEAIVANDGEAAYALLSRDKEFAYRILISDWMMPGMDGLELTRKLRAERAPTDPYRFIILLTARGRPEDRRSGLDAGADDFMVKPLDMGDLIPRLSIAQRMLALEDSLAGADTTLGDDTVSPRATDYPARTLPAGAGVSRDGKEATARVALAARREYDASEVHFEPQPADGYRLRVRIADGTLFPLSIDASDVLQAATYLQARCREDAVFFGDPFVLTDADGERTLSVCAAALEMQEGRDRICLTVLGDSAASDKATLADLPMSNSLRDRIHTLLQAGAENGGVLVVSARRRDAVLLARTIAAFRGTLADDTRVVLDEHEARGRKVPQARLLAQSPDVLILHGLNPTALGMDSFTGLIAGRFVIVTVQGTGVGDVARRLVAAGSLSPLIASGLVGLLAVLPPDDAASNAADRYELRTAEELSAGN